MKKPTISSSPAERRSADAAKGALLPSATVDRPRLEGAGAAEGRLDEHHAPPRFAPGRDPGGGAVHQRFERLRLSVIGAPDRAAERIRQEVVDRWTLAPRPVASFRLFGSAREAGVDIGCRPTMLPTGNQTDTDR